ncbi:hypothetical protein J2797_006428 [Paraburkholderia terricola]|nr:hypothetical protein [Paraburkholderia terricola]
MHRIPTHITPPRPRTRPFRHNLIPKHIYLFMAMLFARRTIHPPYTGSISTNTFSPRSIATTSRSITGNQTVSFLCSLRTAEALANPDSHSAHSPNPTDEFCQQCSARGICQQQSDPPLPQPE